MNKFFEYRARTMNGIKRMRYDSGYSPIIRKLITINWMNSNYYQRLWDITPKNKRPTGMVALWHRYGFINM